MRIRSLASVLFVAGSLVASCSQGKGGAKSAGDEEGSTAYDEEGNAKPCPEPESNCEVSKEASLSFQDACNLAGYRIRLCGCEELCSGNASGAKVGYDRKNAKKDCVPPKDSCPEGDEGDAAFQDACSEAGHQLIECGCEWLCSGKLNEALPDPEPEEKPEEAKAGEEKAGDDAKGDDKKKSKEKSD